MIHQLHRKLIISAPIGTVWEFFSNPHNLNTITPPDMNFEILFGGDQAMYQGQMMAYRIQLFPFIKTRWLTEITQVREPNYFADQQRLGPYSFWNHEHHFQIVEGGVEMIDQVTYQLPFGPLGDLVHKFWAGPRLKWIFDYRAMKIVQLFQKTA